MLTCADLIRTSFVHRADLLKILYDRAVKLGVDIQLGKQITAIEDSSQHVVVTLQDSAILEADLVIGADGK